MGRLMSEWRFMDPVPVFAHFRYRPDNSVYVPGEEFLQNGCDIIRVKAGLFFK